MTRYRAKDIKLLVCNSWEDMGSRFYVIGDSNDVWAASDTLALYLDISAMQISARVKDTWEIRKSGPFSSRTLRIRNRLLFNVGDFLIYFQDNHYVYGDELRKHYSAASNAALSGNTLSVEQLAAQRVVKPRRKRKTSNPPKPRSASRFVPTKNHELHVIAEVLHPFRRVRIEDPESTFIGESVAMLPGRMKLSNSESTPGPNAWRSCLNYYYIKDEVWADAATLTSYLQSTSHRISRICCSDQKIRQMGPYVYHDKFGKRNVYSVADFIKHVPDYIGWSREDEFLSDYAELVANAGKLVFGYSYEYEGGRGREYLVHGNF